MFKVCSSQTMSLSSVDFDYLRHLVRQHSAVTLDAGKEYLVELHLSNFVRQAGFDTIANFVEHLKVSKFGQLHIAAIEHLVNYETTFFRDIYPFEALKDHILPEIIERRQSYQSDKIKIWSAACSSGQEAYSIAMLTREHFPTLNKANLQIIASDFSHKALTRARNGIYSALEVKRGLPANLRKKYFQPSGNEWQIDREISSMVDFYQINLINSWSDLPFQQVDILFLRNVLIYFDINTKKNILYKMKQIIHPQGYLFLGGGETTLNLDSDFERVKLGQAIAYRVRTL
ncbi:CheR methyltransferase, SAM binding domain protein [Calothrix sp. NIES-4071]|nr:CheR methyltransferase, SAM binding domain protein [Calothrix sp. NIES-4071]BAZ63655.1 CheR methyltransferase, SAM binding domain protein [Calothrix sp. NIES-4105]